MAMIEVIANDRLGRKVRVKCSPDDTVGDLKKLIAAQTGTAPQKVRHPGLLRSSSRNRTTPSRTILRWLIVRVLLMQMRFTT